MMISFPVSRSTCLSMSQLSALIPQRAKVMALQQQRGYLVHLLVCPAFVYFVFLLVLRQLKI
jgi:hypothetical protein